MILNDLAAFLSLQNFGCLDPGVPLPGGPYGILYHIPVQTSWITQIEISHSNFFNKFVIIFAAALEKIGLLLFAWKKYKFLKDW